jgi:hypothetical protein
VPVAVPTGNHTIASASAITRVKHHPHHPGTILLFGRIAAHLLLAKGRAQALDLRPHATALALTLDHAVITVMLLQRILRVRLGHDSCLDSALCRLHAPKHPQHGRGRMRTDAELARGKHGFVCIPGGHDGKAQTELRRIRMGAA